MKTWQFQNNFWLWKISNTHKFLTILMYPWPSFSDCQWFDFKAGTKRYYLICLSKTQVIDSERHAPSEWYSPWGWVTVQKSLQWKPQNHSGNYPNSIIKKKKIMVSLFLDNLREGHNFPQCRFFTLQNPLNQFAMSNNDRNPEVQ